MHGNNLVAKTTIPMSVHKFTMSAAPIAAPHLLSEWSWIGASDGAILNESRQSGRVAELALCVDGRNARKWVLEACLDHPNACVIYYYIYNYYFKALSLNYDQMILDTRLAPA